MNTKAYLIVSTIIFAVVALAHLIRFALGWSAQLGTLSVPLWVSLLALLVSAGVAAWRLGGLGAVADAADLSRGALISQSPFS